MGEWIYAADRGEELAQLHHFSFVKREGDAEVEFVITVREYAHRNPVHMRFFAQADKAVNQKTASFHPFGWGDTLLDALAECIRAIRKSPYEGELPPSK